MQADRIWRGDYRSGHGNSEGQRLLDFPLPGTVTNANNNIQLINQLRFE